MSTIGKQFLAEKEMKPVVSVYVNIKDFVQYTIKLRIFQEIIRVSDRK
jgi:hypothetical protein